MSSWSQIGRPNEGHLPLISTNTAIHEFGLSEQDLAWAKNPDIFELFPRHTRELMEELAQATEAVPELVVSMVLGTSAIAVQALFDVQRNGRRPRSCGLYVLAVARSGQRKTTLLNEVMRVYWAFQAANLQSEQGAIDQQTDQRVWELSVSACEAQIKKSFEDPVRLKELTEMYKKLQAAKPKEIKVGDNLVMTDMSWAGLVKSLDTGSPATAVVNDEAGDFLPQLTRMTPRLNSIFDGSPIKRVLATVAGVSQTDPRLSLVLAVQPKRWRLYLIENAEDFAETGLGPRTLLTVCRERQRRVRSMHYEVPRTARDRHDATIARLLKVYGEKLKDADLTRTVLTFSSEAELQLQATADWLEAQSAGDGLMSTIQAYAHRCAENVARVAAILHVLENNEVTVISIETLLCAIAIVRQYALNYREQFGYLSIPQVNRDAEIMLMKLQNRAGRYGNRPHSLAEIRQYMPVKDDLRNSPNRVEDAVDFLERHKYVIWDHPVARKAILLNPSDLGGGPSLFKRE